MIRYSDELKVQAPQEVTELHARGSHCSPVDKIFDKRRIPVRVVIASVDPFLGWCCAETENDLAKRFSESLSELA